MRCLHLLFRALVLLVMVTASIGLHAGLPEVIEAIKPSLVTVGTFLPTRNPQFQARGTGFVVGDGLFIATNAHVLPESLDLNQLETLVVALPREGKLEIRQVARQQSDPGHDLAVLRIGGAPLRPVRLGNADLVREGQSVAFSGFPVPSVFGMFTVTHQGIVASIAPIGIPGARANQLDPRLVRQLNAGPYDIFQLDAPAYPGHSGSPVYLSDTGEVVALINSTFVKGRKESALTEPSGISYAIPIRHLRALLERFANP